MNSDRLFVENQLCCFGFGRDVAFKLNNDVFLSPDAVFHAQRHMPVSCLDVFRGNVKPAKVIANIVLGSTHQSGADKF